MGVRCARALKGFQFTPLREGRHGHEKGKEEKTIFQFTPLREGRPDQHHQPTSTISYFNSRPSARGDTTKGRSHNDASISIHAPPRGATAFKSNMEGNNIFQFTPLREGRPRIDYCNSVKKPFQFTPLREGRPFGPECKGHWVLFQFTPLREGRRQKICNFCKSFVQPLQISMA